jgi:hypothetical protein
MNTDASRLRTRLFNVVPAGGYQMEKLLGLIDIELSDAVPTAAVECSHAPRMLLNPQFLEQHCRRDGHLLMLVMHELQHVILGHTRLFPRVTPAHNIAFDAIINALLCQQFPGEAGFFQALNDWDSFPARLLRPPPDWPSRSTASWPSDASEAERKVHGLLYGGNWEQVTYHELFELLVKELTARSGEGQADGGLTDAADAADADDADDAADAADADDADGAQPAAPFGGAVLIGDHAGPGGAGSLDDVAIRDDTLRSVMRRIVEGWPPPPRQLAGRDSGREQQGWSLEPDGPTRSPLRAALRRLLSRAGVTAGLVRARRRLSRVEVSLRVGTVLPQPRDRRAHAWTLLHGAPPVLWRGQATQTRVRLQPRPVAHVYLDISGSMNPALPTLAAALREPHRTGAIRLFVFSTVIDEARPGDLAKQRFANTGGTDIRCVLQHLAGFPARRRPRRVVLITDGYVGEVDPAELERLRVSLYVGHYALYGAASVSDLARVARHVEELPLVAQSAGLVAAPTPGETPLF